MSILTNFWVQKRYQRTHDNQWMLFLWGFPALSMLAALEHAARKDCSALNVEEESPKRWKATDKESGTQYIVEMTDEKPAFDDGPNVSIRDQTLQVVPERKRMPVPGSLFKDPQMKLF